VLPAPPLGRRSGLQPGSNQRGFPGHGPQGVQASRPLNELDPAYPVPVDAVTASASGLDPHISVANAELQAPRVAAARGLDVGEVLALIAEDTDGRGFGFLGEPGVNVFLLNLSLDNRP